MQFHMTGATFAVSLLGCSSMSVASASDTMSQGHVVTPGERKTILDMCSALCTGETVTIGSKQFAGMQTKHPGNVPRESITKEKPPLKKETEFWDQMFAPSFLQAHADGSDVEKPFPQLVQCEPMCQGHMLMCIRKSGPTELKAAEEYQSCLTGVSEEKKVDKAEQDRLESLRQKEQTLVASMLCRSMCRESEKHSGCNDACDVEMQECLDKAAEDECQQMLGPDYQHYAGPPKIATVQPTNLKARVLHQNQKKAAGKGVTGKVAVSAGSDKHVVGKAAAIAKKSDSKVTEKVRTTSA